MGEIEFLMLDLKLVHCKTSTGGVQQDALPTGDCCPKIKRKRRDAVHVQLLLSSSSVSLLWGEVSEEMEQGRGGCTTGHLSTWRKHREWEEHFSSSPDTQVSFLLSHSHPASMFIIFPSKTALLPDCSCYTRTFHHL